MNVVVLALAGEEPRFHVLADFCEMALQPFKPLDIQDTPSILVTKTKWTLSAKMQCVLRRMY